MNDISGSPYYLTHPNSGTGRGVLVLHAWWGLTPFFKDLCDRLSVEGFTALAPDLYGGKTATTIPETEKLRSRLTQKSATEQVSRAAAQLSQATGSQSIGLIGFSLGGYYALWLAEQASSPVAATVVFYGTRRGDYAASHSAFQLHYAETDAYVSASGVKNLKKALQQAGKEAEFYTYPATSHCFFESDRPEAFNPTAVELARKRTVEFLKKHLP